MSDRNKNSIDDKYDTILHYIIVAVFLSITTPALYREIITGGQFLWVLGMCVTLISGKDITRGKFKIPGSGGR